MVEEHFWPIFAEVALDEQGRVQGLLHPGVVLDLIEEALPHILNLRLCSPNILRVFILKEVVLRQTTEYQLLIIGRLLSLAPEPLVSKVLELFW